MLDHNALTYGLSKYVRLFGPSGLRVALQEKMPFWSGQTDVPVSGLQHPVRLRLKTSDMSNCQQIFLSRDYVFPYPDKPRFIIDAGAYIGLSAIYFATTYPNATVLALEPDKENFDLLVHNTTKYGNIIAINAALWHESTQLAVVDQGEGGWSLQTRNADDIEDQGSIRGRVMALSLDTILQTYKIDQVDILKVDIEGSEREVFAQTSQWIDAVRSIVIELHDRFAPGCGEIVQSGAKGFAIVEERGEHTFLARLPVMV